MPRIGPMELIIILVIVLVIFGAGRLPQIGGAIGKSIREFRKSVSGEEDKAAAKDEKQQEEPQATNTQKPK